MFCIHFAHNKEQNRNILKLSPNLHFTKGPEHEDRSSAQCAPSYLDAHICFLQIIFVITAPLSFKCAAWGAAAKV